MTEANVEVVLATAGDTSRVAILNGGGLGRKKILVSGGGGGGGKVERRCEWLRPGRSLIALLVCLLVAETTALVLLLVQRLSSTSHFAPTEPELEQRDAQDWDLTNSSLPGWQMTNSSPTAWEGTNGSWPMLLQPRCFSMCESADLFYRHGSPKESRTIYCKENYEQFETTFKK
jgi:hypothetical protein